LVGFAGIAYAENYEFCKDPDCIIQYVNGTTKILACNDDFTNFEDMGMKVSDNCNVGKENLPVSDYAKFSKTLHFNRCTADSICFGTFTNGTQIKIQCENRVYHGCGPISFDNYQEVIQCKNDLHVQAQRPNGKMACVYQSTAEKLGWTITNPDFIVTPSIFEIVKDDTLFDVHYEIIGGTITDIDYYDKSNSLILTLDLIADGQLTITLPRKLIDAKMDSCPPQSENSPDDTFFVLVNEGVYDFGIGYKEVFHKEILTTPENRTLQIPMLQNATNIEIIGVCLI